MFKCGIKVYTDFYKIAYVEVQRKDVVITDYERFIEKYQEIQNEYGYIPKYKIQESDVL